jgi:hypothetical protein
MVWFQSPGNIPGQYQTVAASQTTQALGTTGKIGDYLEAFTIIPANGTPGLVTVFDGSTAIFTIPASNTGTLFVPYTIIVRAYSKTGSWNVTTGASVSVVATGMFS